MRGDWKSSIIRLSDLVGSEGEVKNSLAVKEHLQCLVDCINELCRRREAVKVEFEAETIRNSRKTYKLGILQRNLEDERLKAIVAARTYNYDVLKSIKEQYKDVKKDLQVTEERLVRTVDHNGMLTVVEQDVREKSLELSHAMSDVMQRKAKAKIKVNETRLETVDVHERVERIKEKIVEVIAERESYREKTTAEINQAEAEADEWQLKIEEEDKKVAKQKKIMEEMIDNVKFAFKRNEAEAKALSVEEGKLEALGIRYDSFVRKLDKRRFELREEKEKTEVLQEVIQKTQSEFETKIQDANDEIKFVSGETKHAYRKHEELRTRKEIAKVAINDKKDVLLAVNGEMRTQRKSMMLSNDMLTDAMADVAEARSNKMYYSERLIVLADGRETMERVYANEFLRLRIQLQKDIEMKEQLQNDCNKAISLLEKSLAEIVKFRRESFSIHAENKGLFEAFLDQGEQINGMIIILKNKAVEMKKKIQEVERRNEHRKATLKEELEPIYEKLAEKKVEIKELGKTKINRESFFLEMKGNHEDEIIQHKKFQAEFHELFTKRIAAAEAIKNFKHHFEEKRAHHQQMKEEFDEVQHLTAERMHSMAVELQKSGLYICMLMHKNNTLREENRRFEEACGELEEGVQYEGEEIDFAKETLFQKSFMLACLRKEILLMEDAQSKSSLVATQKTLADLKDLWSVKDYFQRRETKQGSAIHKFDKLVQNFTKTTQREVIRANKIKSRSIQARLPPGKILADQEKRRKSD